jgi:hypothetical protein
VDPALLGTKTKPGAAPPPVTHAEPNQEAKTEPRQEAKTEPRQEAKTEPRPRPSIPARAGAPSMPAPGPSKRSLPPARRKSDEAVEPAAPAQPAPARALSVPPALPSAKPPAPMLEHAPIATPSIEVAPDILIEAVAPAPTPEPRRALSPQSALETLKLPTYTPDADAELVRSFRRGPALKLSGRSRWIAGGLCTVLLGGWVFMRGAREKPSHEPIMAPAAAELVPLARAAEPTAPAPAVRAPSAPEPVVAAPTQAPSSEDEEPLPSARGGRQTRESARRAGLLCNQGNDFKNKKMLPTARVRYLEALRLYPDYPRALAGLTQLALGAGDGREALKYGKQLVKARPGQAAYQLLLGDAYRAAHDEKAAREAYQTAQRLGSRTAQERLGK